MKRTTEGGNEVYPGQDKSPIQFAKAGQTMELVKDQGLCKLDAIFFHAEQAAEVKVVIDSRTVENVMP